MAFFLLGTVVYLFYILSEAYTVPALAVVVGVWFACWLIGRIPITSTPGAKAGGWLAGIAAAALTAVLAFNFLVPYQAKEVVSVYGEKVKVKETKHLKWYMFSPTLLDSATADGKTVMVDFTARWCPTCKWNMARAIDKERVSELISNNDVVPILADLSEPSEEIDAQLKSLNAAAIPILAIYPADRPNDPIVLRDTITEQQLLAALEKAGASKPGGTRTAMKP